MIRRLADYFAVVGYDFDKSRNDESEGKVHQRFPVQEWSDYPYEFHIENFCQPGGWCLTKNKSPPTFFIAYLTDTAGNRYFCATLTFLESLSEEQRLTAVSQSDPSNNSNSVGLQQGVQLVNGGGSEDGTMADESAVGASDTLVLDPNLVRPVGVYAPKCLVLLARHEHFEILKNCLSIIYTVYIDSLQQYSLEHIISNLLSAIDVPPIGGPRLSFSIGAGDRQVLQPPLVATLPITRSSVAMLFKHLGIQNVLLLFSAVINDQKIILFSRSIYRLTEACHALTALIYPLGYGNVFVPILPKTLLDVVCTPTPFIAGVHVSCKPFLPDVFDVFTADLDGGSVFSPENVNFMLLSEPFYTDTFDCLTKILNPDLLTADDVYAGESVPAPDLAWQDKRLRAVFLRLFAQIFHGYRFCLFITRIHPKLVIHFNKETFLLLRGFASEDFVHRLLCSMSFDPFIEGRGPPFRVCDVFDEVYEVMPDLTRQERDNPELELLHIDRLAKKLWDNENSGQRMVQQLPPGAVQAHRRIHQTPFPQLEEQLIDEAIAQNLRKRKNSEDCDTDNTRIYEQAEPRFVPLGPVLDMAIFNSESLVDKKKVLKQFVENIFNNHITEALKRRNTIRQDLKSCLIRRIFVDELCKQLTPLDCVPALTTASLTETGGGVGGPPSSKSSTLSRGMMPPSGVLPHESGMSAHERRALLTFEQFDLVVDLLEETLRQEGHSEYSGAQAIILEISTKFCTQLNNMRYYANMTNQIQRHPVWSTMSFWENCFNDQVNQQIRQLYIHYSESQNRKNTDVQNAVTDQICPHYTNEMSTLDIAADELKIDHQRQEALQAHLKEQEVHTVYSQVIHFITMIVNLRLPVNICSDTQDSNPAVDQMNTIDGFDVYAQNQMGRDRWGQEDYKEFSPEIRVRNLENWLKKFVDKVCGENFLDSRKLTDIKDKIESIIEGHIQNLERIYPEVKSFPKFKKPLVTNPTLFPNEFAFRVHGVDSLSCQLLLDGRFERIEWHKLREGDPCLQEAGGGAGGSLPPALDAHLFEDEVETLKPLLPAQGALFVTNYRVIFRGAPKDPYQSNKLVCRSFPISSLLRVKKLEKEEQVGGLELRSTTMQMMKIGLDSDEVMPGVRDDLINILLEIRYPIHLQIGLSFPGRPGQGWVVAKSHNSDSIMSHTEDDWDVDRRYDLAVKPTTLKRFAKDITSTMHRFNIATPRTNKGRRRSQPYAYGSESESDKSSVYMEEGSLAPSDNPPVFIGPDSRWLTVLQRSPGYQEYTRLGLGGIPTTFSARPVRAEGVKVTQANSKYELCKSYPALVVIPQKFTEGSLLKVARSHRQNRFPVIVWRHPTTHGYLVRASGFQNKGVFGMFKNSSGHAANTNSNNTTSKTLERGLKSLTLISGQYPFVTESATESDSTAAEQERYFRALVEISPRPEDADHESDPLASWDLSRPSLAGPSRRLGGAVGYLDRAITNIKMSGLRAGSVDSRSGRQYPTYKSYRTVKETSLRRNVRTNTIDWSWDALGRKVSREDLSGQGAAGDNISITTTNALSAANELKAVPLYILGEKSQMKTMAKSDRFQYIDFIPVEFVSKKEIRESFQQLFRVCLPGAYTPASAGGAGIVGTIVPGLSGTYQAGGIGPLGTQQGGQGGVSGAGTGNAVPGHKQKGFFIELQDCDWLAQIQSLLQLSGAVVDLMDIQQASVAVCLEDGWNSVTQVVSLAQVMLDPEYRTIRGFWALIEKEWLMFGHQFNRCSTQTASQQRTTQRQQTKFVPVFLQFLDAVHQLVRQFPLAFEFHDFFLRFLAYHHLSNRFVNFKYDQESARSPWMRREDGAYDDNSIWKFIQAQHEEWPIFYNFRYSKELSEQVLRPSTMLASLRLWDYFLSEDLATGSVYDLDQFCPSYRNKTSVVYEPLLRQGFNNSHIEFIYAVLGLKEGDEARGWMSYWKQLTSQQEAEEQHQEPSNTRGLSPSQRRMQQVSSPGSGRQQISSRSTLLGSVESLVWCHLAKQAALREHKKSSLSRLDKRGGGGGGEHHSTSLMISGNPNAGGTLGGWDTISATQNSTTGSFGGGSVNHLSTVSSNLFSNQHRFVKASAATAARCHLCTHHLLSLGSGKGVVRCQLCNYLCHEKCAQNAPKGCTGTASSAGGSGVVPAHQHGQLEGNNTARVAVTPASTTTPGVHGSPYHGATPQPGSRFREVVGSPATNPSQHSGHLYKQSHRKVLQQWKMRYFVLDPVRHQLRYYEDKDDGASRGFIDLQEVRGVRILRTMSSQKRFPENAFIELETQMRTFRFGAEDSRTASEWVERIQTCIL